MAEPELALRIIAAMAHLLLMLNQRVEELPPAGAGPPRALSARPLQRAGLTTDCRLPFAKQELAARLGTVPETLSRTLNRFVRGGLIAVNGNSFEVLNPPALERLADSKRRGGQHRAARRPIYPPTQHALVARA